MPYQIIKYENISQSWKTYRSSQFNRNFFSVFGSLWWSRLVYVHIIVDNSTEQLCGKQQAPENKGEKRLLSSFDYNHDLSVLLFCIKLNFMITLIALFMSLSCYYALSVESE